MGKQKKKKSGLSRNHCRDYPSKCSIFCFDLWVRYKKKKKSRSIISSGGLSPLPAATSNANVQFRHVYDNIGLKGNEHIYENVGELRDATPDLILAVKPKVPLDEEQVMDRDQRTRFCPLQCVLSLSL